MTTELTIEDLISENEARWLKLGRLVEVLCADEEVGPAFPRIMVHRVERKRGDPGFEYIEFKAGNLSPERYDRLRGLCETMGAKLHVLSEPEADANVRVWP